MTHDELKLEILRTIRPGTHDLGAVVNEIMAAVDQYVGPRLINIVCENDGRYAKVKVVFLEDRNSGLY